MEMFDTYVTIVGNALHEPEWRKTANTGALVCTFKIASTARRFNRDTRQWVDGNSLRVRVTCWRSLASNVKESVTRGDPLIVTGRLFTRDWMDEEGTKRTSYELEALSIGHDLNRGRAVFERRKANTATSEVEDPQAAQRAGGEPTEVVPDDHAPAHFNNLSFEDAYDRPPEPHAGPPGSGDLARAGEPAVDRYPVDDDSEVSDQEPAPEELAPFAVAEPAAAANPTRAPVAAGGSDEAAGESSAGRRRGLRRTKVPA